MREGEMRNRIHDETARGWKRRELPHNLGRKSIERPEGLREKVDNAGKAADATKKKLEALGMFEK